MEFPATTRFPQEIPLPNKRPLRKPPRPLVAELERNHIKAHVGAAIEDLPLDTLVIIVGSMPTEYFDRNRRGGRGNMVYQNVLEFR